MFNSSGGLLGGSRPASALAYAGRSGMAGASTTGGISFEDAEHAQMITALRQPLFIQTPLQAMLENMVDKLQTQAAMITALQEKVGSLERTNLNSRELLERVRLVEGRLATVTGGNLSPFNQAELLQRVDALEARAGRIEDSAKQMQFNARQDAIHPRLDACEQRLAGVHNLAGHLMAVHAVAEELGVVIPQPQLTNIVQLGGMQTAAAGQAAVPSYLLAQGAGGGYGLWSDVVDRGAAGASGPTAFVSPPRSGAVSDAGTGPSASASASASSSSNSDGSGGAPSLNCSGAPDPPGVLYLASQDGIDSSSAAGRAASPGSRIHTFNCLSDGSSSSSANGGANVLAHSWSVASAAAGPSAAASATSSSGSGIVTSQRSAAVTAAASTVPAVQLAGKVGDGGPGTLSTGALTRSKQQELQQQIDVGKQEAAKLQQQLDGVHKQVEQLRADAGSNQDQALSMLANLADQLQALSDRLDASFKRKEALQAAQQAAQVSLADFTLLQSKVEAAAAATAAAGKELHSVKTKELPELSSAVADLSKRLGHGPRTAVSEVDKLLASQVGVLQEQLSGLTARLDAQEAAELAGQGVATQENLQELARLMTAKASKDDMRAVLVQLGRAVDLALEAYRNCMGDSSTSGASRTRCLVCERTLLDRSSSPPRTAPAAPGSSNLPLFEPFRPSTAAVHSSSSSSAASSNNVSGRAHVQQTATYSHLSGRSVSDLPSDNYIGPGAAGEALGVGPLGPGLNAAQLRRMAEKQMHSTGSSSGPSAAPAVAGQGPGCTSASGELAEGVVGVFSRSVTPGSSISVMYSRPGPYSAKQQQQQQQRGDRRGPSGVGLDDLHITQGPAGGRVGMSAAAGSRVKAHKPQGKHTPVFV